MRKTLLLCTPSLTAFCLLFSGAALAQPTWVRHDIVKNFTNVYAFQAVDMDKDGRMDFLSASRVGAKLWRNNGNGTFSSSTIGSLEGAWAVVGADVEGDGDIDVAAASPHPDAQQMRFWKNNNGWQSPKILPLLEAEDLTAADLDGDGSMEIIGCSWAEDLTDPGNDLVYFKNYLNGSGTPVMVDPNLSGAHSVVAADFDKDGDNDLIASGDGRIKLYRNDGGANFATPKELSKNGALCVNAYDVDGDGDLDLVTQGRNPPNQNVYWWEQTAPLSFTQRLVGTNVGECWSVHAGDLDGDGDMDITAASQTFRTIRAYLNNGAQQFTERVVVADYGDTRGARYAIPLDVDGDGDADIIGAAPGTGTISWFETISSGGGSQSPMITSFSPSSGAVGTEVTINGANLDLTTQVSFNGTSALFQVESATRVRTTVPAGATTGRIRVVTVAGQTTSASDFTVTSGGGGTTAVTFLPGDDTFVKSSAPSTTSGSLATLRVRRTSTEALNAYLKFEVVGVGSGVQRARLRLYVTDDSNNGGSIYAVSNNYRGTSVSWRQSGLNWNNAPEISGSALSSIGAVSVGSWIEFDVSAAIAGDGVYSFAITSNTSNTVYYSSKEGANRPQLIVETTTPLLTKSGDDDALELESSQPGQFTLLQNYPNPFNPVTQVVFDIPREAFTKLTIFDVLGRQVTTLVDGPLPAGRHQITWEGRDANGLRVSSGMYFYQLRAANFIASKRMLLLQ